MMARLTLLVVMLVGLLFSAGVALAGDGDALMAKIDRLQSENDAKNGCGLTSPTVLPASSARSGAKCPREVPSVPPHLPPSPRDTTQCT